jgi:hypothetical protein
MSFVVGRPEAGRNGSGGGTERPPPWRRGRGSVNIEFTWPKPGGDSAKQGHGSHVKDFEQSFQVI